MRHLHARDQSSEDEALAGLFGSVKHHRLVLLYLCRCGDIVIVVVAVVTLLLLSLLW